MACTSPNDEISARPSPSTQQDKLAVRRALCRAFSVFYLDVASRVGPASLRLAICKSIAFLAFAPRRTSLGCGRGPWPMFALRLSPSCRQIFHVIEIEALAFGVPLEMENLLLLYDVGARQGKHTAGSEAVFGRKV